ncbi:Upstream activation factor subunit spp27 [Spatholobus suberectus]|nr:Upstream activation factor subunit spp27 [Spatholobus suberectus]
MFVQRVLSRSSATLSRSFTLLSVSRNSQPFSTTLSNHLHSLLHPSPNKLIPVQASLVNPMNPSLSSRFGFSSTASPEPASDEPVKTSEEARVTDQSEQAKAADQTKESDVESECDLSRDDLIKLVSEKEQLLKLKHKEIEKMQHKVLRTYAEMENVMERTGRGAENSKKFAIQGFKAKMLPQRMKKAITDNPKKLANLIDLVNLPSTLREFVGQSQISRLGCFKCVWSYIKTNNLQDPNNKNVVNCDEKLKSILLGKPQVELAELPALIKLHFPKEPK